MKGKNGTIRSTLGSISDTQGSGQLAIYFRQTVSLWTEATTVEPLLQVQGMFTGSSRIAVPHQREHFGVTGCRVQLGTPCETVWEPSGNDRAKADSAGNNPINDLYATRYRTPA